MKRILFLIALVFLISFPSFAQNGGGIFQRGSEPKTVNETKGLPGLPPHGEEGDQPGTPVGSGVAVMTALGAMYLVGKKRKK